MKGIPKDIEQRCEFETRDSITRVVNIKPAAPCEFCNISSNQNFVYRIGYNSDPYPHRRFYCSTCKQTSVDTENWYSSAKDLNELLRTQLVQKNQQKQLKD